MENTHDIGSRQLVTPPYPVGPGGGGSLYLPSINPQDPQNILVTCDMHSAFGSLDGGNSFHFINLWGNPRWFFSPHSQSIVYACADRFSYLSLDKGKSWRSFFPRREDIVGLTTKGLTGSPMSGVPAVKRDVLRSPAALLCVYVHPVDPDTVYVMSQGRPPTIFRTTDGGKNWTNFAALSGSSITVDSSSPSTLTHALDRYARMMWVDNVLHVVTNNGFHKINAAGEEIYAGAQKNAAGVLQMENGVLTAYINIAAPSSDTHYSRYIVKTSDFGETFTSVTDTVKTTAQSRYGHGIPRNHRVQFLDIAVTGDAISAGFTGAASSGSTTYASGLVRSVNGGRTWNWILDIFGNQDEQFTSLGPIDVWTGSVGAWGLRRNIEMSAADPNHILATSSRDIYETRDGGITWRGLASRRTDNFAKAIPNIRPQVGDPRPFWTTTGIEPAGQMAFAVNPRYPLHQFTGWTDQGIFETFDGGKSWTIRSLRTPTSANHPSPGLGAPDILDNNCCAIAFDPHNEGVILAATPNVQRDAIRYHSVRGFKLDTCLCDWRNPHSTADCPCAPYGTPSGVRYFNNCTCQSSGYVVRSTDNGKTWTRVLGNRGNRAGERIIPAAIVFDPVNKNVVYMATMGTGVLRSVDSGLTWHDWNDGIVEQECLIAGHMSGNVGENGQPGGQPRDRRRRIGRGVTRLILGKDNKTLFALMSTLYTIGDVSWGIGSLDSPTYQRDLSKSTAGWIPLNRPTPTALFSMDKDAEGTLYAVPIMWRRDNGNNATFEDFNGADVPFMRHGGAFVSANNGATWRQIFDESVHGFIIRADSRRSNILYLTTGVGAFVSDKGKDTTAQDWLRVPGYNFRAMSENIYEDPLDPSRFYVTTWGGGTWSMPVFFPR